MKLIQDHHLSDHLISSFRKLYPSLAHGAKAEGEEDPSREPSCFDPLLNAVVMEHVTTLQLNRWSLSEAFDIANAAVVITSVALKLHRICFLAVGMKAWQTLGLTFEATAVVTTRKFLVAAIFKFGHALNVVTDVRNW